MKRPLTDPRPLFELENDCSGQLVTEWVLVTAVAVMPIVAANRAVTAPTVATTAIASGAALNSADIRQTM